MNTQAEAKKRKTRRRKRHRGGFIYILATLLVITIAVSFSIGVFFKINAISVEGNSRYTRDNIREASGIAVGDNLFSIDKEGAKEQIAHRYAYIDDVQISRQLPDTVIISVSESSAVGYIFSGDRYWMINQSGKIVDMVSGQPPQALICVSGIDPLSPTVGDAVFVSDDQKASLDVLLQLLGEISDNQMIGSVSSIDLLSSYEAEMTYIDRFTIRLEFPCDVRTKIRFMQGIAEELESNARGEIDLTGDEGLFIPEEK